MIDDIKAVEKDINVIISLIREGRSKEWIAHNHDFSDFEELFSFAKARIRNIRERKVPENYFFTENDVRFATNQLVAEHRAERLKCGTIIDIGCGVGVQAIAFAKTCKRVIAIDIDERKVMYAKLNAGIAGVDNIIFMTGDALALADTLTEADIVFCDPERPASEEQRKISSMQPDPKALIKKISRLTDRFCFEFPPQMRGIPIEGEKEYCSVDHELNRLSVYCGSLKNADCSAVVLPEGALLTSSSSKQKLKRSAVQDYIYEVDGAVLKAELAERIPIEGIWLWNEMLTSRLPQDSPFFKACYRVMRLSSAENLRQDLATVNAGSVVFHARIAPEKYWEERRALERGLSGRRQVHLFMADKAAVIAERI